MANLTRTLKDLRKERSRAKREVQWLDKAISALERLTGRDQVALGGRTAGRPRRRKFSALARARMARAQRARWAKLKAKLQK